MNQNCIMLIASCTSADSNTTNEKRIRNISILSCLQSKISLETKDELEKEYLIKKCDEGISLLNKELGKSNEQH